MFTYPCLTQIYPLHALPSYLAPMASKIPPSASTNIPPPYQLVSHIVICGSWATCQVGHLPCRHMLLVGKPGTYHIIYNKGLYRCLFPFYPLSSHSLNPPNQLSLSSMWLLGQVAWVLLQKGSGVVVHGVVDVDELALGWPTYGHWPGCSTVAVGGHMVVVVVV